MPSEHAKLPKPLPKRATLVGSGQAEAMVISSDTESITDHIVFQLLAWKRAAARHP